MNIAASSTREMVVVPVAGRIGAEIRNVSLSKLLDDLMVGNIRKALVKHKVIFFRDQHDLDDAGQEAFAARIGDPIKHPNAPAADGSSFLLELKASEGYAASIWHTDMTFMPAYPQASILRALVIPEAGGDTIWANTASAYEELPPPLRLLADGLKAIHSNLSDYEGTFGPAVDRLGDYRKHRPQHVFETEHPVVRVHPESGERSLLLGHFVKRFAGMTSADSQRLMAIFQDWITRPENCVRWRWQVGDVAVWDNRATQHRAVADFGDQPRQLRRATIHGTVPTGIDGAESRAIVGDVVEKAA